MTYAFTGQPAAAPPRGWKELDHPETLFPQDPVLAQAARAGGRGMLCRRQDETFCLVTLSLFLVLTNVPGCRFALPTGCQGAKRRIPRLYRLMTECPHTY